MDNKTAVEIIKSNWPAERYSTLRQALSKAIRALEREDRREERANVKNGERLGRTDGRAMPGVSSDVSGK